MRKVKNILAIIYKNWRTSFAGLVCLIGTIFLAMQRITVEQFMLLMGFCGSLGLFFSKDGQTQNEYDKEHNKGIYQDFK